MVERGQGAARAISSFIDSSLCWEDLAWFKTVTKLPILLKGVQCYEVSQDWHGVGKDWCADRDDGAGRTSRYQGRHAGCRIEQPRWTSACKPHSHVLGQEPLLITTPHRGAQEFARSGIEVLVEVVSELKARKMWPVPNFEIMVDGGVRRASDVLKAVALGATAVGIGRPFLYAMSTYGQEGIEQAMQILKVRSTTMSWYAARC